MNGRNDSLLSYQDQRQQHGNKPDMFLFNLKIFTVNIESSIIIFFRLSIMQYTVNNHPFKPQITPRIDSAGIMMQEGDIFR